MRSSRPATDPTDQSQAALPLTARTALGQNCRAFKKHCSVSFTSLTLAVPVCLTILGSGSAGNCAYVETDHARLLIDAGLSLRQIRKRLATIARAPEKLTGILITH